MTFNNSLFDGTYRLGPISLPQPDADISQGYLAADGSGTFTATEDVLGSDLLSVDLSGNYSVDGSGRTLLTVTNPESFQYVMYPVSSSRFIGMSIETGDNLAYLGSLDK